MKLQSYWWVSVPALILVVVAVTLWMHRPAAQSTPPTPAQSAATSTPQQEPDTPRVAAAAEAATDEQPEQSLMDCMSDLPRLLAGVPELAVQGIVVSMGAASGDASVSFLWPCRNVPLPEVIALTPNGAEPLSADVTRTESKVEWACGGSLPAVALTASRRVEKGDLPIALGAQAARYLKWIPAKPVDGTTACAPPRAGFAMQQQQLFELPGREGRWSSELWERTGAPAEWQGALAESRDAAATRIFRLSRIAADGTCSLSAMTQADSDGQSIDGRPRLTKAFGLLSLQGGDPSGKPADEATAEKAWMIFQSPSYEGNGVSAIPLDADGMTLMIESRDSLLYSGC